MPAAEPVRCPFHSPVVSELPLNAKRSTSLILSLACAFGLFSAAAPAHAANEIVDISDATLTERTIQGSYTVICPRGETRTATLDIFQLTSPRSGVSIRSEQEIFCTGEEQTFTYTATPQRGTFRPGTAEATLALVTCSEGTCIEPDRATEVIQLTR